MINLDDTEGSTGLLPRLPGLGPSWPNLGQDEPLNVQQQYMAQRRALESDRISKLYLDEKEFARLANQSDIREGRRLSLLGDDLPKVALNAAYLSHRMGRKVTASEYELARDNFAAANFGQEAVTDGQFFDLVKGEYDVRRQKVEALDELRLRMAAQSLEDGAAGADTPAVDTWKAWKEKHRELVGEEDDLPYLAAAVAERNQFKQVVDKYKHLAGPGLDLLKKFTAGEASGEELSDFAKTLAGVPREEQDMVIDLIALGADGGQIDRGALKEFATSLGQTFSRGFNFIPQRVMQDRELGVTNFLEAVQNGIDVFIPVGGDIGQAVVGNAPAGAAEAAEAEGSWRRATEQEREQMIASGKQAMAVFQIERQLRAVADNNVDPIKRIFKGGVMGAAEGGVLGVVGSIPILSANIVSPVGAVVAYQAMEYDRIRSENRDMDVRAAFELAGVEGAWQALLDRLQIRTMQGKGLLPSTGRLLGKIKSTGLRRAVGYGGRGLEQFGQELAQDIGTMGIDALASAVREDMKDQNFALNVSEYWKQAPEVLVSSLIFGLLGGKALSSRDIKVNPTELDEHARIVGISEEGRQRMRAATTPEELDAVVERELKAVTPESQAAGALYAKAKRQAAEAAQADPNEPTLEVVKDAEGNSLYRITTPDGETLVETRDAQAAQAAFLDYRTASETNEVQALKDVISYWQDRDPELSIEQAPAVLVKEELDRLEGIGDAAGIERLRQRLVAADINPDGELAGVQIFGSTTVQEVGENVYRGTILVRQGAAPETVLEEVNHAFVRRALMRGDVTVDQLSAWLDQTAAATGLDIKRGNEIEIIESIAQVGMDLFNGRLDQAQLPQSLVDYLRRLMRVVKEIYVRAVKVTEAFDRGEIDGNFEQFLMQSMGMDPQQQIEINSTTNAAAVATGAAPEDFSIGITVAPLRRDTLTELSKNEVRKRAKSAKFIHLQQIIDDVTAAYGVNVLSRQPVIGTWTEKGQVSLEVPETIVADTDDLDLAEEIAALIAISAPELQNGAMLWRDDPEGPDVIITFKAKSAEAAMEITEQFNKAGVMGSSYDVSTRTFSVAMVGSTAEDVKQLTDYVEYHTGQRRVAPGAKGSKSYQGRAGTGKFPGEAQYRGYLQAARDRADQLGPERGAALRDVVSRAERRLDRQTSAAKIARKAQRALKKLNRPKTSAALIESELKGRTFDNIRQLGLYLDARFRQIHGKPVFTIGDLFEDLSEGLYKEFLGQKIPVDVINKATGDTLIRANRKIDKSKLRKVAAARNTLEIPEGQIRDKFLSIINQYRQRFDEGIRSASDALVYDILDGLATDGSGMGWYDERVQETIRELAKTHPEFADDPLALSVYIGILASTSQGYTVVENFKQADRVYAAYKATGRLPLDLEFAKGNDPINSNLAQIQELIDTYGLEGYAEFMDAEVTGQALRDQYGMQPTGVTLEDVVRGNRVLGPKIGSFFNNLRGRFDTITMDLWYTRTMHRYLGETVVPLESEKMQDAIAKFRGELTKDGARTYGLDIKAALKDDESTVQAALTLFQRWARGKNEYAEKGYMKFPDGYAVEKAARTIFASGGMKGAPQNKTHRNYFADVVLAAQAKLSDLGFNLNVADMQAIVWYREKNLFGRTGVANAAAKPADYLDAVMVSRQRADAQEETDLADIGEDYSLGRPRVDRALASAMNRKPGERLAMYERAKQMFNRVAARRGTETGPDGYARTLQSLWELDAILKVLPAEVRGKVGGFTRIAELEPVDLYRGDELVTESNSPAGARIAAWMQEGLNIGEAGKKTELPEGYSIRRNTDPARATKATDDFLVKRLATVGKQLDRYLANEYRIAIERTLEAARPKRSESGVRKSNLGPQAQALADKVREAALLDNDQTAQRLVAIEAELVKPETADARRIELVEEWGILNTFGDLDGRNAETLAQGLAELRETLKAGRMAWRTKEEERIAGQRMMIQSIINGLGEATKSKRFADKGKIEKLAEMISVAGLDHGNFEQFLRAVIPDEAIVTRWSDLMRKADTGAQDMELAMRQELVDAIKVAAKSAGMGKNAAMAMLKRPSQLKVRAMEGRKVTDERISIELAQKIVRGTADRSKLSDADVATLREALADLPADTRKKFVTIQRVISAGNPVAIAMSPAQAIQLELSWDQPDVQEKMRREGWTDESIEDIRSITSEPVAAATLAFLRDFYARNYAMVNPVYARMFGMNMPQAKFYAPSRFLSAGKQNEVGLDGTPQMTGSTPGFAKARVSHSSPIDPVDALTVYQQHVVQTAHWVNFSEFAREARAVTSNLDLRESISQKYGELTLQSIDRWVEQLEQRGANKSREMRWMGDLMGAYLGGTAISSLGFNMRTVAINTDSAMRFSLVLTPRQIGSVLMSPAELAKALPKAWKSATVQRRLKGGMDPATQFMFARRSTTPGLLSSLAWLSMQPVQIYDAAGTTLSSAMVYLANYQDAKAAGMPDAQAEQVAFDAMDAAVYRYSQPTGFGSKSNIENNAGAFGKLLTLFMSDPRLKTGVMLEAVREIGRGKNVAMNVQRILAIEAMALVSHVIASAYRDAFSDEEDEDIWSVEGFALAMLLAPFQGLFPAGAMTETALRAAMGMKMWAPPTAPFAGNLEQGIRAVKNYDQLFTPESITEGLKAWNNLLRGLSVSTPMGAPAALLNIIKPFIGLQQNLEADE